MYFLYSLSLYLLTPLVLLRLFWLSLKSPEYMRRWQERFGYSDALESTKPVVWLHAVSVGEVQAAKPLVEHILKHYSDKQLLLTTTTPTGALTVEQLFSGRVSHRYFPYDLPGSVRRFLNQFKPVIAIIMETEIWPNLYAQCNNNHIPVTLINARLSERSCKGYKRFSIFTKITLQKTSLIAAQTSIDAERFLSLGAKKETVHVAGNLKFDIKYPHSVIEAAEIQRQFLSSGRLVWIAGSTHEGEEKIVFQAFRKILDAHHDCLLIIAPRHPERFQEVVDLSIKHGFKTIRHTEKEEYQDNTQVYVLDTLGELPVFYATADVSFVGGSLVSTGGHNMLEPAALGTAVISGHYLFNFIEVAELLESAGALIRVENVEELATKTTELLNDANQRHAMGEKGRQVVLANQGTVERILQHLQIFL